jgi:hypothetical protein
LHAPTTAPRAFNNTSTLLLNDIPITRDFDTKRPEKICGDRVFQAQQSEQQMPRGDFSVAQLVGFLSAKSKGLLTSSA